MSKSNTNKQIAEDILADIINDAPISNILLKTQIYASKRKDKELLELVNNEINGYEENLPGYRIINARVNIDISRPFQEIQNYPYPIEMVRDQKIRKRLSQMPIHNPLSEIEIMAKKNEGSISIPIPYLIWEKYMTHCINGKIQGAYQYAEVSALNNIITSIKSLLIDFFTKIEENNDIEFSTIMKQKENVTINYNAAVINTGEGTVNASTINNVIGDNNIVSIDNTAKLQDILKQLNEIIGTENEDYNEISSELEEELATPKPSKNIVKRCFQAIKGLTSDIVSEVLANQCLDLIQSALSFV